MTKSLLYKTRLLIASDTAFLCVVIRAMPSVRPIDFQMRWEVEKVYCPLSGMQNVIEMVNLLKNRQAGAKNENTGGSDVHLYIYTL
jgi:hypothetical protein